MPARVGERGRFHTVARGRDRRARDPGDERRRARDRHRGAPRRARPRRDHRRRAGNGSRRRRTRRRNAGLLDEIARRGCVVTEQLMGTPALKFVFPRRNRLISAFSRAVVVVEAGERSGALITARWALEQGRDVGAVPGFPGDARSRGANALIKTGAFPVERVEDIFEAVPRLAGRRARGVAGRERERVGRESRSGPVTAVSCRRSLRTTRERVLDAARRRARSTPTSSRGISVMSVAVVQRLSSRTRAPRSR